MGLFDQISGREKQRTMYDDFLEVATPIVVNGNRLLHEATRALASQSLILCLVRRHRLPCNHVFHPPLWGEFIAHADEDLLAFGLLIRGGLHTLAFYHGVQAIEKYLKVSCCPFWTRPAPKRLH